jgi:hypothetical protein
MRKEEVRETVVQRRKVGGSEVHRRDGKQTNFVVSLIGTLADCEILLATLIGQCETRDGRR